MVLESVTGATLKKHDDDHNIPKRAVVLISIAASETRIIC